MLISVIIPAYRAGRYIAEALASVERQSCTAWEVIVVEDGSDDGAKEAVAALAARQSDKRIIYHRHERNHGVSATRNSAMERAQGEIFAFLDADDVWTDDHLEASLAVLQETGADAVYGDVQKFDRTPDNLLELWGPSEQEKRDFPASLYYTNFITPSSVLMSRKVYDAIGGFDPKLPRVEDLEYWIRLFRAGFRFVYSPKATCLYRKNHGDALTSDFARLVSSQAEVLEMHMSWGVLTPEKRRDQVAYLHEVAGRHMVHSAPVKAARSFTRAWMLQPRSVRLAAHAARALATAPLVAAKLVK